MKMITNTIGSLVMPTPSDLLKSFVTADANHSVRGQYGDADTSFYDVPSGISIDNKTISGWLALPLMDTNMTILGIAYISPVRNTKPIFDPHLMGCVILGTPSKEKPLFVVSSIEAAFAISRTGFACLLTFTPYDWCSKNSPKPKDAGNMAHVIKSWTEAGFKEIYAPVGCDVASTYKIWLKGLTVQVLPMTTHIDQYIATSALKSELIALTKITSESALETIELAFVLAEDEDNPDAGALWEAKTIKAFQHIYVTDKPEWARLRVRLKKCKSVKFSEIEREIITQSDDSGYVDICSILIGIASTACTFVHDPDLEPYALLTDGHVRKCWHLHSKFFSEWLSHAYYKAEGTAPSEQALKAATNSLSGKAKFEGEQHVINIRIAKHEDSYWIDLCNDAWQAVKITKFGWQVIDLPNVIFTRTNSMRPLPTPIVGTGNLAALWEVANIPESDRLLILTWLLECLRPETPYVLLELSGEQGSAKSSTQNALRNLIDPNRSNLRTAPKNKDDVFISAKNSHMISYENLSHLSADYQDTLCTISTGAGYASRTLYTNSDETVIELKKPVVLNGISTLVTTQDDPC